jgi:hypothetical protein
VGTSEGKGQLARPVCKWEDNIKMELQDGGWGTDWIAVAQDRDSWRAHVKAGMKHRVPQNAGSLLTT